MHKTPALLPFRHELVMVGLLVLSACTGTSSLPGGGPSSGTNPPGSGGGSQVAGGTGATSGAGAAVAGGGNAVGIGAVVPTTQLDPGRVMLRRLNIAEYNNTVRDLLGTASNPADKFTGDNVADGFDTLGEALSFSDVLGEAVENAATTLATELLARPATDPIRTKILVCAPTAANLSTCLTQIMTTFMKNAYRRPVTTAEVANVVQLASTITTSSGDINRGLNAAFKRVLLSPYFMFHVELGTPNSSAATNLNDYELASRLSYFLWSSMPDATLMQAADATMLSPAAAPYSTQVDRMLADPKAQGLVDNFAGQWLWIRQVSGVSPDPMLFPTVDQALLDAIPQETGLFFKSLLTGAKPLSTLLLANYTFVNARLAKHYGLAGGGTAFAQVTLPATSNRMGILTQETFLTTTSQPNRTSPVKRGEWVLEQLLCDPPPAPPPNVPTLPPIVTGSGLTGRAYLEQHVQNPYCAGCHTSIDPIGFTLENFDAVGSYRTLDNAQAIDPSGVMPDGTKFSGPTDLAQSVAKDPRFPRCMTKQMMTYAIGRSFDTTQALAYVAGAADPLASNGTWTQLVHTVAASQAFLTRRGEGP